ncbi:MAG: HAD family hydrolase [Candidatus Heimdallarchaeota archaeon]
MRTLDIPNYGKITIKNIVFDVNGTIQFKGRISKKFIKYIKDLKRFYEIYLISADTRGNLRHLAEKLHVNYIRIFSVETSEAEAKNNELLKLGKDITVAIGNGNNDYLMLKNAIIGIAILGEEGSTKNAILNSDVILTNVIDAINFLLDEKTMIATLRA